MTNVQLFQKETKVVTSHERGLHQTSLRLQDSRELAGETESKGTLGKGWPRYERLAVFIPSKSNTCEVLTPKNSVSTVQYSTVQDSTVM